MKKFYIMLLSLVFIQVFLLWPGSASGEEDPARAARVAEIQLAVQEICMSMKPYMIRPDKIKSISVVDNPEINAYADAKGNIVFFTGMIDFVRSENEIAAVCGHEMSHIDGQHIKRSIGNSILSAVVSTAVGGTLGDVAGGLISNKQSRKHEREADSRGLNYMWSAGYDPESIWKFWNLMDNKHAMGASMIESYFSTHPVNDERIENLKVLLVRTCKTNPGAAFCDRILANQNYVNLYNAFESR